MSIPCPSKDDRRVRRGGSLDASIPRASNRSRLWALVMFAVLIFVAGVAAAERPPIVAAAKLGDRAAVRALVEKKADANAPDQDGTTALHWAAYRDDLDTLQLLIRAGATVNAANDLCATPLWNATEN